MLLARNHVSQDVYYPIGVDDVVVSDVVLAGVAPTLQVAVDSLIPFHLLWLSMRRRKTSGNLDECVLRIALCHAKMANEVVQTWRGFPDGPIPPCVETLAVVVRSLIHCFS